MQLHQLPGLKRKRPHRIGRGGKRGSYSGRGIKGQRSRAGRRIRPAIRDLIIRIPKRRGFRNKVKTAKSHAIDIRRLHLALTQRFKAQTQFEVTPAMLRELGLLKGRGSAKLLGKGALNAALHVKGVSISAPAKQSVLKAGGTVE